MPRDAREKSDNELLRERGRQCRRTRLPRKWKRAKAKRAAARTSSTRTDHGLQLFQQLRHQPIEAAVRHHEDQITRLSYVRETSRLYGALNKRLADRAFVAGDYSIADMAA